MSDWDTRKFEYRFLDLTHPDNIKILSLPFTLLFPSSLLSN